MVALDWRVEARAGVSLVELLVANPTGVVRRVRIANRLDGPTWPPRREGVPEAGWDDGGFEGLVPAGGRRALGYASPASPVEPPAEVVWTERAGDADLEPDGSVDATPVGVVRALGDARPPADAVPTPAGESPPDPDLPESVESWLSGVEARADPAADVSLTPRDRATLDAVAGRLEAARDGRTDGSGSSP